MTRERCSGEPVSWLRLERYHLGEVALAEREAIAAHLAVCSACAACLAAIERDDGGVLPPLVPPKFRHRGRFARFPPWTTAAMGAAAAAAVWVSMTQKRPREHGPFAAMPENRAKGDAIAFSLVRDDGERVGDSGGIYRSGDRFKAVVTCAPGASASFDVAVFDTGAPSFPLPPAQDLACGNDVPLPGAFRLTGTSDETVCLFRSDDGAVDRSQIAREVPGPDAALCKRLHAAPPP